MKEQALVSANTTSAASNKRSSYLLTDGLPQCIAAMNRTQPLDQSHILSSTMTATNHDGHKQ